MNRAEAQRLIQQTFERPFDKGQYARFANELVNGFEEKPLRFYGAYVKQAFRDHVRGYERLGSYTDPNGESLDILFVELRNGSALDRARTMQRNVVADYLKTRGEKDAALVAYFHEGRTDWRFSFVKMDYQLNMDEASGRVKVEEVLTPARRFSFLVGQDEPSHTAQRQLFPILEDDRHNPTLAQLEAAFSIETVTQAFFEEYKTLFLDLKEAVAGLLAQKPDLARHFEQAQIGPATFAKKLLGQIVFLYFLQKKGWLGVQPGGDWGSGPQDFLSALFAGNGPTSARISFANFYTDILEPLFYTALATERPDHLYAPLNCRIPFLNGGLFEPIRGYDWQQKGLTLPNDLFGQIFQIFDRYNFTVREDEPLEKEVAVDPEMLGKVFENLLEVDDRKSKGAFYTPREIVHYMCQESLIHYLDTAVNVRPVPLVADPPKQASFLADPTPEQAKLAATEYAPIVPKEDLALFIRHGDLAIQHDTAKEGGLKSRDYLLPQSVRANAQALDQALADVKVCDPAIGSGAFPVGIMQEIVKAREVLTTYLGTGLGEEAGEETGEEGQSGRTAYAFKRHAIQESIYGVDLDPSAVDIAKLRLWLSLVVDEEDYRAIKPLPNLGYKIVQGNSLQRVEQTLFNNEIFARIEERKADYFVVTDRAEKEAVQTEIDGLIQQATAGSDAFDFHIYFSEVFQHHGGFNVVIGNPPYVRQELIQDQKPMLKQNYPDVYTGTADLYVYFYACGFGLLKERGVLAYITSNKFMRASYGKKLRGYLGNGVKLHTLIDFGDAPVFDATAYPVILIASKEDAQASAQCLVWEPGPPIADFFSIFQENQFPVEQQSLGQTEWQLISPAGANLLAKMQRVGTPLGKFIDDRFYRGIVTGYNKAFVIDKATKDRLIAEHSSSAEVIKPFLRGRDVKRWVVDFQNRFLIFTRRGIEIDAYPAIKRYLLQFKEDLMPKPRDWPRGKPWPGRKAGSYEWYEIQDNIAYWQEFEQPKIIIPAIVNEAAYAADYEQFYGNDKTSICIPQYLELTLGILNSKLSWWFITQIAAGRSGGYFELKPMYVSQIPIATGPQQPAIEALVEEILARKQADPGAAVTDLEAQIDQLVYQLYGLTPKEIALVEEEIEKLSRGSVRQ